MYSLSYLLEEFVHVALLGHQDGALAVGHGLEELHSQATGAHLGSQPHPALAVILHLHPVTRKDG